MTRVRLQRLRIALFVAVLAATAGALLAINAARADAETMRTQVAPTREGLAAAQQALVEADSRALAAFGDEAVGPDELYQLAVAAAGRQLAQVSQADLGGTTAEGVQVVESLLNTYTGLMEQARGYRATGSELDAPYLQYAHLLLQEEILPQLRSLRAGADAHSPPPAGAGRQALWVVPLLVLLGLLIGTQMFLARRFRRVLSLPLLLATVFAVALGGCAALSAAVDRQVDTGRAKLTTLVGDYQAREDANRADSCRDLQKISRGWAAPTTADCPPPRPAGKDDRDLVTAAGTISTTTQAAADRAVLALVAVLVLAALTALSITAGLLPRLEEYRFRRR